MVLVQL